MCAFAASAAAFLPARKTIPSLQEAARGCRGCPLYENATQTVFGAGPKKARVMMIGEQPGNEEDLKGLPFVGPSGRLLDQALEVAGIARGEVYVTNVVKHFKWEPSGKRRLHKKPTGKEISACLPWLDEELELIKPEVVVLLGATPTQALLGKKTLVTKVRGQVLEFRASHAVPTVHPSSILRQRTSEDRARELKAFEADLGVVARLLR
jgi:uracil-DNA glycosylase